MASNLLSDLLLRSGPFANLINVPGNRGHIRANRKTKSDPDCADAEVALPGQQQDSENA